MRHGLNLGHGVRGWLLRRDAFPPGGRSNDTLDGGEGRDMLIGGRGADNLCATKTAATTA